MKRERTSRDEAKARVKWCVQGRRNGGYWAMTESHWNYLEFQLWGDSEVKRIPTTPRAMRWVYA